MPLELTYGLERVAMFVQNVENIFDIEWNNTSNSKIKYSDIFLRNEKEFSVYNFERANVKKLFSQIEMAQEECYDLLNQKHLRAKKVQK